MIRNEKILLEMYLLILTINHGWLIGCIALLMGLKYWELDEID